MSERFQGYVRRLAHETLSQQMTHCGRLLEAVTGESTCAPEAIEVLDATQYGLMIGGHLVEARPSRSHAGGTQVRRAPFDHLSHGVERGPVDFSVETGRLVGQTHAKEQALTLGVEVERG